MSIKDCPIQGPWIAAGTKMVLGVRTIRTWNATTKQWEMLSRPGITQGPTGEKVFRGKPHQLI